MKKVHIRKNATSSKVQSAFFWKLVHRVLPKNECKWIPKNWTSQFFAHSKLHVSNKCTDCCSGGGVWITEIVWQNSKKVRTPCVASNIKREPNSACVGNQIMQVQLQFRKFTWDMQQNWTRFLDIVYDFFFQSSRVAQKVKNLTYL